MELPLATPTRIEVQRRAYVGMVTIAVFMGLLAFIVSRVVDYPLRDPDGFIGPA